MNYIGIDSSDELRHWKYIKRYKGKNGKWRYIYATKKDHENYKYLSDQADKHANEADKYQSKANKLNRTNIEYMVKGLGTSKSLAWDAQNNQAKADENRKLSENYKQSINNASISSTAINKVNNFINKVLDTKIIGDSGEISIAFDDGTEKVISKKSEKSIRDLINKANKNKELLKEAEKYRALLK